MYQISKKGESAGTDLILNVMLKVSKDILVKPIYTLFNKILSSGKYPKNWDTSIITTIFKSGHSSDINSKLFTKILNNRICDL